MVRIKHRYLLVHIFYPEPVDAKANALAGHTDKTLPDLIQFHRPSPSDLTPQLLARAIRDEVQVLYGDYGLGLVSGGLSVKYLSPATSTAIIRCSRAHYRLVWAALSFMTQLSKNSRPALPRSCAIQVVRVSGTIKKAEEEAIKRARAAILRAKRESGVGSTDGLMAVLGQADNDEIDPDAQRKVTLRAGSNVSDEEDEEEMDSDGDG